jgi:hypothetical protein
MMILKRLLFGLICTAMAGFCLAQSSSQNPTLGTLMEGDQVVSGKASPGSGPITIYDASFPAKTQIGKATAVADDGTFSSSVDPPLVKGHQIIAVDQNGNASAQVTVIAASQRPGPAPQ